METSTCRLWELFFTSLLLECPEASVCVWSSSSPQSPGCPAETAGEKRTVFQSLMPGTSPISSCHLANADRFVVCWLRRPLVVSFHANDKATETGVQPSHFLPRSYLWPCVFTGTWVWREVSCCRKDGCTNMESSDGSPGWVTSELFWPWHGTDHKPNMRKVKGRHEGELNKRS